MVIIPAIDLKEGRCVRLRQGKMDSSTVFSTNPPLMARQWADSGAERLHVVDLDGSIDGRPINLSVIKEIVSAIGIPVQLGGGIRDGETIKLYLDIGVDMVILGTMAARDPEATMRLVAEFPNKIAVGIDAKNGRVAVQGWTESTDLRAIDLAARFASAPPARFIYTDIERDGMMRGPNIEATREFALSAPSPVILSGGVSVPDDVERILPLEDSGVVGMIIGRALYEGSIDLKEIIETVGKRNAR